MSVSDLTNDLAAPLGRYLIALAGVPAGVRDVERLSSGWESDVYAFRTEGWRGDTPRVLRLYFGDRAAGAALREYQALRLLADVGYPVPRAELVEPATGPLGRTFLIMERLTGTPVWEMIAHLAPNEQTAAVAELGALQARLHQVDLRRLPAAWPVRTVGTSQQIDHLEAAGRAFHLEDLGLALAWLRRDQTMQEPPHAGLVHWDYHPNNVLQGDDGRRWVIDWTQFQATDVRFDLAWTLLLVGSHAGQSWADALLGGYRAAWAEPPVWLDDMTFFDAAACAKRVLSVVISLTAGPDKVGMRPGAEDAMRRLLPAIAAMYRRWLTLTRVTLPTTEQLLAAHL